MERKVVFIARNDNDGNAYIRVICAECGSTIEKSDEPIDGYEQGDCPSCDESEE